jgi:acyl carrier protein
VATPTPNQIFEHVKSLLIELFEIEPEQIKLPARLYKDLDVDSIDAVDLMLKLKDYTGRKIKPDDFKQVQTIEDVVTAVQRLFLLPA